jgi:protein phosphatase
MAVWCLAARTDPGRARSTNEDGYLTAEELDLFAVADGMGGHNAGEVASTLALETLGNFIRSSRNDSGITWPFGFVTALPFEANQLKSAVQLANQEIRFQSQRRPECDGMGSTVVAAIGQGSRLWYVSVGDSRLYLWRGGALSQLSEDDSWAASMLRAGADPGVVQQHAMRNMLTRALGTGPALDVDVAHADLRRHDLLLLCSDGLYGPLGDEGLAAVLKDAGEDLEAVADALVAAANDAGGPDNITAVLLRYEPGGQRKRALASESGQAMTEYAVTAGLLVAIGIAVSGMLISIMKSFVTNMLHELSFLSP